MSSNPAEILQDKLRDLVRRAPKIAGRVAVSQFQENIRRRGGTMNGGSVEKFQERKYETQKQKGKRILTITGNMVDSIRIISTSGNSVTMGISQGDIAKYARMHQEGGTITVTPKMKKFFWAMYYQSSGKVTTTEKGAIRKTKSNLQLTGDAAFYHAMALKRAGSKITIPKREFMRFTPDVIKEIHDEFKYEIDKIIQQFKS